MEIKVLGVGSAFSPELGNSSIILWEKGKGLLIDCGYTVFPALKRLNYLNNIDSLFITHRHGDHIGSLDTFLYYKRFLLNQKVTFYGISDHMEYLEQIDPSFGFDKEAKEYFNLDKKIIKVVPSLHAGLVTNAFYDRGVLYSGDVDDSLLDSPEARDARIIIHEVSFGTSAVHTSFDDLKRASNDIKAKTWLTHYNKGEFEEFNTKVMTHGFRGMLRIGQSIKV